MAAGWLMHRIEGAMYGGAIGDALGGPVEGASRERIEALHGIREVTDMLPYVGKGEKGEPVEKAPPGTTTDDTHFKNSRPRRITAAGACRLPMGR